MKTILVDDILESLNELEYECSKALDIQIVGKFTSPIEALEYAKDNEVDVALLDIDMPEMSGLELELKLKEISPEMITMFVTAHAEYAIDAMRQKADYIIFKPYDSQDIEDAIDRVRRLKSRLKKKIRFQTFGSFAMFVDDKPVKFSSAKGKELLAFCVANNGRTVTANEIIFSLWEDYNGTVKDCSNYRTTVKRLMDDLKKHGVEDIFVRDSKMCMVKRELADCDYFKFMDFDKEAILNYNYEFMSEYSWSENYIYHLMEIKRKI